MWLVALTEKPFCRKGLLPSTIKGYRSSITRTLTISGGTNFSNNDFLSLLIRNFDLERPKQKRQLTKIDHFAS
jgi:hypothetical protein